MNLGEHQSIITFVLCQSPSPANGPCDRAGNMKNDRWQPKWRRVLASLLLLARYAGQVPAVDVCTRICVFVTVFSSAFSFSFSLYFSLLPLTPLLQPLWFTWLCPVSTFWHKSQLTRPTVCTLRPRHFKWPKPIGIHTLPPPAALAFKVKVTSTTLCYPQLGKSSQRALYLFIFKWPKSAINSSDWGFETELSNLYEMWFQFAMKNGFESLQSFLGKDFKVY